MCMLADVGNYFIKLEEMIVKDQVLRCADSSLSAYLKEKVVFKLSLDEVIKLAENFQAIHGKSSRSKSVSNETVRPGSFKTGTNVKTNKDYVSKCFACGKDGHIAKLCKSKFSNFVFDSKNQSIISKAAQSFDTMTDRNKLICYQCGGTGNTVKECPSKFKGKNYIYKKTDLTAKAESININFAMQNSACYGGGLPLSIGKCNNKTVKVLRDTGTTAVLVKSCLVNPDYFIDKNVLLQFADDSQVMARQAKVYIKSIFVTGSVEEICLSDLPFDVLIGNVPGAKYACSAQDNKIDSVVAECDNDDMHISCAVQTRAQKRDEFCNDLFTNISKQSIKIDMTNISTSNFVRMQASDCKLRPCFKKSTEVCKNFQRYVLHNGVLIKLSNKGKNSKDIVKQIVLPSCLINKVIRLAHDTIMSGHLGVSKTQKRVLNNFLARGVLRYF